MIQRMFVTIDTKKTNYKNVGKINHGDDLILELTVLSDGNMISFNNPMVDLLVKKSDGKMIRQNSGIEHIKPNKFIIEVSKDCVTSPGLSTNQLIINDNGRISTCMFYYTILNSLEEDIIQSISNVEVLEQLDEFTIQMKDKMENFDEELQNRMSELEDAIDDLVEFFGDTSVDLVEAELSRNEAEQSRAQAESVRVQNESRRLQNDLDLANTEAERVRAENVRIQNEADRALVDAVMDQKESKREDSELERIQNESKRATDELVRQQNENTRQSNESVRISNENDRKTQENRRATAETNRVNAETTRRNNENSRISNETERQKTMNEMKSLIGNVNDFDERVGVIEDEIGEINSSLETIENEKIDKKVLIRNNSINQGININSEIDNRCFENYDINTNDYSFLINTNTIGNNLRITKSQIHSEDTDAIELNTNGVNIENILKGTIITDNFLSTGTKATGTTSGFGIGIAKGQDIIISNNICKESRREGLHIESVSRNIIVSNNLFLNCHINGATIYSRTDDSTGIQDQPCILSNNIFKQYNNSKTGVGISLISNAEGQGNVQSINNRLIGFDTGISSYIHPINVEGTAFYDCNVAISPLNNIYGISFLKDTKTYISIGGVNSINRRSMFYSADGFTTEDVMDKDLIIKIRDNNSPAFNIKHMSFKSNIDNLSSPGTFSNSFIKAPIYMKGYIDCSCTNSNNFISAKFEVEIKDGTLTSVRVMQEGNGNMSNASLNLENGYLVFKGYSGSALIEKTSRIIINGHITYNYKNFS